MNISVTRTAARLLTDTSVLKKRLADLLYILDLEQNTLSVVFMGDEEIAEYNQQYRNKTGPTNVLSFPVDKNDVILGLPVEELGDVLISVETAQREAAGQETDLTHRLTELLIHGVLHLAGWDHERSEEEAVQMWDKEKSLLHQILQTRRVTMPHLAINVDHVATVRQARGTTEPDPVIAAGICELAGAEGIVVHLREDRRHIQDRDVRLLRETIKTQMNLEMAMTKEMIEIALEIRPDMVTLVPEKREELTTEGGLEVAGNMKKVSKAINKLAKGGIPVSLFIDPDAEQVEAAAECGATYVELHTGRYCDAADDLERDFEFRLIEKSAELAADSGLRVNAGHGLDYRNTGPIAAIPAIEELSIGHAVISRAVIVGLDQAVREMLAIVKGQTA